MVSLDGNNRRVQVPSDRGSLEVQYLIGAAVGLVAVLLCPQSTLAQFVQQGPKLVAQDIVGGAQLGFSAALSADGNTAIVGGPSDNNAAGAAWVFTRSNGTW